MGIAELIKLVSNFGMAGMVFVIWYWDRKDINKILAMYREDMAKMRKMYESNVSLVQDYDEKYGQLQKLYSETIDIISLNTQTQTQLTESIKGNLFCPIIRKQGAPQL